nr:hypothetical protein bcere0006_32190 [Bacillus wiedmannii]
MIVLQNEKTLFFLLNDKKKEQRFCMSISVFLRDSAIV